MQKYSFQELIKHSGSLLWTIQEVISSASGLAKVLNEDLLDSTAKLMELVETAGANVLQYGDINQSKGGLPAQVGMYNLALVYLASHQTADVDLRPWGNQPLNDQDAQIGSFVF